MAMPASSSISKVVYHGEEADLDDTVVDLGEAADLDDATSKLFFSDTSAAGTDVSWPAVSQIESTLRSQDLVALCSKHGVPSELAPVCAEHLGWRACTPPPAGSKSMCVYTAALDAGLRFPLHGFYVRVLRHFNLAPSQLTPNSWTYLAAFVLRCQDADVEPLVSAFRHFFTISAQTLEGKPTGYHHFMQSRHDARRRLFKAGTLSSWPGWKSRFFFLDCPSGWKCPVKWGKPKRKDARRVQLTSTAIDKLKAKGCIDIKHLMANREMPVGDPAAPAPQQSALKMEAGAAGPGAAAAGAAAENASTSKRRRLSPAEVLSQPQPLPTSAPPGSAPIRASSTRGHNGHIPPPQQKGLGESASARGGRSGYFLPPQQQSLGELPGMRAQAQAVRIGGSNEVTPPAPHTMFQSDAWSQLLQAKVEASQQAAMIAKLNSQQAAMIAKLNQELHVVKNWNTQWQKEVTLARDKHAAEIAEIITQLHAAKDCNNHLNGERNQLIGNLRMAYTEVAQLKTEHAAETAQLKEEHAAETAQLKEELAAEANHMKEEHAYDLEQFKQERYIMGASDMRDLALTMYKQVINPDELKVELLLHQGASPVAPEDQ